MKKDLNGGNKSFGTSLKMVDQKDFRFRRESRKDQVRELRHTYWPPQQFTNEQMC